MEKSKFCLNLFQVLEFRLKISKMDGMKLLLIGSGGREHSLAWKLKQSPLCESLICAPGNAGISEICPCVAVDLSDISGLVQLAVDRKIDLVVVGPELPLSLGVVDRLQEKGIPVFGPTQSAARLEGSKGFMKDLCRKYGIPTARYERFTEVVPAEAFIDRLGAPVVVKADGLAAGKGVVVASTTEEAKAAARDMLSGNAFGAAGASVVVEEFLDGEEISYFVLADGKNILPLTSAQDHKRAYDGDQGPNTGGMGAYSPARLMTPALEEQVLEEIIRPTVKAMIAEGCPFTGVLYAGLMIVKGRPLLLEYNARFGDPECQTLMLRLDADLVGILKNAAEGKLDQTSVAWLDNPSICVVMAAKGYPADPVKNTRIGNLEAAAKIENVEIFHAGTYAAKNGEILSNGGRVLGVCAVGDTLGKACNFAYQAVDLIDWPEGFCRRDIGWRALKEDKAA